MAHRQVIILNPWDAQGAQIADSSGIYPTIRGCGGGGYQQGYVLQRGTDELSENHKSDNGKQSSGWGIADRTHRATCWWRRKRMNYSMQAFGLYKESEQASSLKRRDYKDATDLIVSEKRSEVYGVGNGQMHQVQLTKTIGALNCMHDQQEILRAEWLEQDIHTVVRRLTELECERLQGFPDNWTLIGEPDEKGDYWYTDTTGKRRKVSSSARYKALGNSIALPFWRYLARRIMAQYEHEVTMGSLFSGIGGFELVFSQCGAKPLWNSEIEEFPIAVTKQHFGDGEAKGDWNEFI